VAYTDRAWDSGSISHIAFGVLDHHLAGERPPGDGIARVIKFCLAADSRSATDSRRRFVDRRVGDGDDRRGANRSALVGGNVPAATGVKGRGEEEPCNLRR
jgi:hypothetical protein